MAQNNNHNRLRILETCLYVDDLDLAEQFYSHVLGLTFVSREKGRHVFFECSPGMLLLFNAEASSQATGDIPTHGATGPGHVAFAVSTNELETWRNRLNSAGVTIEAEVAWQPGLTSIYFRDPAGNSLELAPAEIWRRS